MTTYGIIGTDGDGISGVDEDYLRSFVGRMWSLSFKVPSIQDLMLFCRGEIGAELKIGDTGYVTFRSEIC